MLELARKRNELLATKVVTNLERRGFGACYCATTAEAVQKALSLLPEGSTVAWGGSASIRDSGLTTAVHAGNYTVIDRDLARDASERFELHRQGLLSDCYLMSTNALSEDGILVNIDGTGNRLAALCFGPRLVVMLVGINKVAKSLEDAISRARTVAAPVNAMRFMNTPCTTDGSCHNCTAEHCICNQLLLTRNCRPAGRIQVILVGEELGF